MGEPPVIADERDLMQAALSQMSDAFTEACQLVPGYEAQGRLQHAFFDAYAEAKRVWGRALVLRDVAGKAQGDLAVSDRERARRVQLLTSLTKRELRHVLAILGGRRPDVFDSITEDLRRASTEG